MATVIVRRLSRQRRSRQRKHPCHLPPLYQSNLKTGVLKMMDCAVIETEDLPTQAVAELVRIFQISFDIIEMNIVHIIPNIDSNTSISIVPSSRFGEQEGHILFL